MFLDAITHPGVMFVLFLVALGSAIAGAWWQARTAVAKAKAKPPQQAMQVNVAVVAVVVATLAVLFQLPSLSIDINGIFTYAFDVVNAFMPLIAIVAGLGLGFNLITKISGLFNRAF